MKFEYIFPDVGEGIAEGVLIKWLVEEGDSIKEGDSVAEVETDKVTTEIPSARTGKVLELKFNKGDTIKVGEVFIVIGTGEVDKEEDIKVDEEDIKQEREEKEELLEEEETAGVVGEVIASSEEIPPSTEGQVADSKSSMKKALATPVARKMAKDLGIDINTIEGTGPNGRVMKEDIKNASDSDKAPKPEEKKSQATSSEENVERIPLTSIRKTIAARMSESRFTIPHTTAMDEIDVTELDTFRKKYKELLQDEGVSLTYLPFIVKAIIKGLKAYPEFNSELDEENQKLILKHYYHIGIATDTDRGLMVPVIRDADKLSIVELAKAIEDITNRAKENKIELHELRGSTFSITNYGSIGGHFGIPIINYPEAGILGLGRIVEKPIVEDGEIVIKKILPLSLSYDHRTIDGASGARLLNTIRDLLSDPQMLLLKS